MDTTKQTIKQENTSDDLLSLTGPYTPDTFEPDEWMALIDVIITSYYHVQC
jgi:hypothetical protein